MAFSIKNTDRIKEQIEKSNPAPFQKETEVSNWLSLEKIVEVVDRQLEEMYQDGGMEQIYKLRDNYQKKLEFERIESGGEFSKAEEVFKVIIRRIYHFEADPPNKISYKDMKKDLVSLYEREEDQLWEKYKTGKGISDFMVSYLKDKYPNAKKHPKESTIRKDWLGLTA